MEFLRFGSNIPGSYWGCCACCIIQNFKVSPDAKAAIQLIDGDGGVAITNDKGQQLFAGPTYRDIFHQRLRFGTFSKRDMPNHGFLAILTSSQIAGGVGKEWMQILKEAGFEFVRTINNSVYTGAAVGAPSTAPQGSNANYLFGLFRGIGTGAAANPFMPPQAWLEAKGGKSDSVTALSAKQMESLSADYRKFDTEVWDKLAKAPPLITEEEARAAGCQIWMAGRRGGPIQHIKPAVAAKDLCCAAKVASPVAPAG